VEVAAIIEPPHGGISADGDRQAQLVGVERLQ
jgi:hypothetical protein